MTLPRTTTCIFYFIHKTTSLIREKKQEKGQLYSFNSDIFKIICYYLYKYKNEYSVTLIETRAGKRYPRCPTFFGREIFEFFHNTG